ncbi:MAG: Sua5/YciO/YrdC/YwlC family protein [Egibacteraceae bacterium]
MSETIALAEEPERARRHAADALRAGGLVVVPTDSVYALVADAFSPAATPRPPAACCPSRAGAAAGPSRWWCAARARCPGWSSTSPTRLNA